MATKRYLMTPGPTPVPPQVLAALAEPIIHHRAPEFRPVYEQCLEQLRTVARTESDVLLFGSSGTGAFESAVANLVTPGERHLVVSAGNFGERWAQMTAAYGADVDHLRYAWGIDVVVSGSQKALMCPPGLAFNSVSAEALDQAARATSPRYVFDWERTRKAQAKLDAPFTPAVSLVKALDVALGMLLEEGLEAAFERHARLGRACREGIKAMGLELFSPDDDRSAVVTAVRAPSGIDAGDVVASLRDRFGITIAGGQGELKGKIFRIGHIGWFDVFDITTALAAVELALAEAGVEIERGLAVTRALEAFEHAPV